MNTTFWRLPLHPGSRRHFLLRRLPDGFHDSDGLPPLQLASPAPIVAEQRTLDVLGVRGEARFLLGLGDTGDTGGGAAGMMAGGLWGEHIKNFIKSSS